MPVECKTGIKPPVEARMMTLSEEATERLADIVTLQPTKNATLADRWGMDSGSEVHQYLESELDAYYYRNDDSLICATPEAAALVGEGDPDATRTMTVSDLESAIVSVLPDPDGDPQSVVATLHAVRETGRDPEVDDVRSALHKLVDQGIVSRIRRTVPTFRLAVDRDTLELEVE